MPSPPASPPARLSDTAQAAASVLLAAYLLGLVLTIAVNSVSGSSLLLRTIKGRLFSPWMQPAWLDLGFDQPLTYGLPEDAAHRLEIQGRGLEPATVRLPAREAGGAARWRRLARAIAVAAADDDAALLVAGVAAAHFASVADDDVTVRVLRRPVADRSAPNAGTADRQIHAARVRRIDGELQVIEVGTAAKRAELAPLLRRPAAGGEPGND